MDRVEVVVRGSGSEDFSKHLLKALESRSGVEPMVHGDGRIGTFFSHSLGRLVDVFLVVE